MTMYRLYFLLVLVVCNYVLAQDCVTENFENGIASFRQCVTTLPRLMVREYSALNMISPHPRSTKFITPTLSEWSCMISSNFTVTRGGTLEVNRYTTSKNISDVMWVFIRNAVATGVGTNVVSGSFSPSHLNFVPGWQTFRMIVPGTGTFEGTVSFDGRDPGSLIAIDSYRFISPTYNKDLCKIYDDPTTSTTSSTTTKAPQTTTTTQRPTESPTTTTSTTSDKSTATTTTSTTTTTSAATTTTAAPASSSTQAPRLSISLQNRVKEFKLSIQKFF